MRTRPQKYSPLSLLQEDLLHGHRVHRIRDKVWLAVFGTAVLVMSATALHVKSNSTDFQPMRHPLAVIHVPKNDSSTRYLVYGSYDSHGHGLKDYTKAHPYLLSEDVHNAALHVGGPALGAVCTQSMTGEGIYDVIVLDFPNRLRQGFRVLAKRLRQRFPNALIIIVKRWSPAHIVHSPLNGTRVDAISWIKDRDIPSFHHPSFLEAFNKTDPHDWIFTHDRDRTTNKVLEMIDGRLVQLTKPKTAAEAILQEMHLFHAEAPAALSEWGHQVVADLVKSLVDQENIQNQDPGIRNELGSWFPGDSCHMWYTNGQLSESMYKRPAKMVRFAKPWGYKYALEFAAKGGSVLVHNPFDIPRALYLTYMTHTTLNTYPVQVFIQTKPGAVLEPTDEKDAAFSHSPRTVAVGFVNPGTTEVRFESLGNTLNNFRLTGASLLGNTEVPFEHTLELEPVDSTRSLDPR